MSEQAKRMRQIEAGELVVISSGEYSDYEPLFVARAKRPFDPERLRWLWLEDHPDQRGECNFKTDAFAAMLVTGGYVEELPWVEFHVGGYGCSEKMWVRGPRRSAGNAR